MVVVSFLEIKQLVAIFASTRTQRGVEEDGMGGVCVCVYLPVCV